MALQCDWTDAQYGSSGKRQKEERRNQPWSGLNSSPTMHIMGSPSGTTGLSAPRNNFRAKPIYNTQGDPK